MAKNKTIVKNCPKCESRVAVASKSCKCGYSFFNARRKPGRDTEPDVDERRRTGRVRREKPNYYDSQEYDKKKTSRVKPNKQTKTECEGSNHENDDKTAAETRESTALRAKRRRLRKEEEDGGGDLCAKLSADRQQIAAMILNEINRKIGSSRWQP